MNKFSFRYEKECNHQRRTGEYTAPECCSIGAQGWEKQYDSRERGSNPRRSQHVTTMEWAENHRIHSHQYRQRYLSLARLGNTGANWYVLLVYVVLGETIIAGRSIRCEKSYICFSEWNGRKVFRYEQTVWDGMIGGDYTDQGGIDLFKKNSELFHKYYKKMEGGNTILINLCFHVEKQQFFFTYTTGSKCARGIP